MPLSESLGRRERTDYDAVPVRISKCKLQSPCVRVQVWLLFEPSNESPRSRRSHVELVHTEKQEQAVAGLPVIGARQGGMLVGTPQVETEQDRAIRVADLPEVVMGRRRLRLAKERLVPFEATSYITYPNNRPCPLHCGGPPVGLIL